MKINTKIKKKKIIRIKKQSKKKFQKKLLENPLKKN
jgi:hypothetical protein